MTQAVNLANFSNSLDSSGQVSPSVLNAPVPLSKGGTNAITAPLARASLGAAASGANSDITSITGLTTALTTAQGGTGVTTSTGTGNNVLSTSPTLVTPVLGTPTSGNLANCTFPTLNQNTTGSAASATDATNILGNSSQTYQNVTGSRSLSTTYTNSTGKPIWVAVAWTATGNGDYRAYVGGNLAYFTTQDLYPRANVDFVVPIGATYYVTSSAGQSPAYWLELR